MNVISSFLRFATFKIIGRLAVAGTTKIMVFAFGVCVPNINTKNTIFFKFVVLGVGVLSWCTVQKHQKQTP